ncbi:MAG: sulfite oxidase [Chloroflexi bacterium]|nr:sulfite oxidase [Chloroflexota bacterium]
MSRFLVEHRHRNETCPSGNAEMVQQLAGHLHPENAARFGVQVLSDCVIEGEHTLIMVLEAESPDKITTFVTPFLMVGSVNIRPVITCDIVAARAQD